MLRTLTELVGLLAKTVGALLAVTLISASLGSAYIKLRYGSFQEEHRKGLISTFDAVGTGTIITILLTAAWIALILISKLWT